MYLEAMKELGVQTTIVDQQKVALFDSTLDAGDPEKYAHVVSGQQRRI